MTRMQTLVLAVALAAAGAVAPPSLRGVKEAAWCLAKCAAIAALGPSVWALGASTGAGPAIVVAQGVARASAAPLVYMYEYVVDDADAKAVRKIQ